MKCRQCQSDNLDGQHFCATCGERLADACAECGCANPPGDGYCGGCGDTLASAATNEGAPPARKPLPTEPERRQLTMMFCDLVGSTALSSQLDPEDLREVIQSYQKCTSAVIARYEGFVTRFMGDGILVFFGYPIAHEDDAARAIHSGLEIVEALQQFSALPGGKDGGRLSVRIGIATGLVVVGDLVGEGVSARPEAMGETPNLAARLQGMAKPNCVVVARSTRALAGGVFEYADQGTHKLKGFSQPVRAWRVLGTSKAENRFEAARSRRLTPIVGRKAEIELLLGRWMQARQGDGHVVLLSGEAGVGKSRIAETLKERIAGEAHIRLRYQCSPYHTNSALYPFIDQLERAADLLRSDTTEQKLDKLESLLAKSERHDAKTVSLLAALLSLPLSGSYPALYMSPQQQKDKTLAALFGRLPKLAAKAPVLVLFEDAHWIDPTSLQFLNLFVQRIKSLPVLAIISSRTKAEYPWLGLPHVSVLHLERLDRLQSATMVGRLLEGRKLPAELIEQIVAKTDGVPLFIEELTKTLVTSAAAGKSWPTSHALPSEIPSTLQDSLMARLDQLGPAKEVAQLGAAIGREFSRDLLAAISPLKGKALRDALNTLTSSMVVFGLGERPWTTFVFKHALVQDAAYASLLRARRREFHERIAQTLESSYPDRVRIEPEVVAHHYTQAGQSERAAGYWAAAARRALERSASEEALGHACKGLDLLAGGATSPDRDRLELGLEILRGAACRAVKGFASSEVERSFTRARELCERLDDIPRLMDVRRGLFSFYYARGALALAREEGHQVAALGQRLDDAGSRMLGHWMLGCIASWQGDYPAARRELEEAVSLYDPNEQRAKTLAQQIDPGVNALGHLARVLWGLGYPDQAIATSEQAIRIARQLAQPYALAMALFFASETQSCCGRTALASQLSDELVALAAEQGFAYLGSCARVLKAQELIAQGQCVAGLAQVDRALSEFRAQEAGLGIPWSMSISAAGYVRLGKFDEAHAALSGALLAVSENGERHWEAELHRLKGELLLLPPASNDLEAEACLRRAIDLARQQSARSLELRAATALARLLARQGKTELARRMLGEIYGWFSEGSDTADLRDAGNLLQSLR